MSMRRALLVLAGFAVGQVALAQMQRQPDVVLTATRAVILLDPVLVVGQYVHAFQASPDGRYIVALRSVPSTAPVSLERPPLGPVAKELIVWDSVTGTSKTIPLPLNVVDRLTLDWFPGTDRALATISYRDYLVRRDPQGAEQTVSFAKEVFVFDASEAKLQQVRTSQDYFSAEWWHVVSPIAPLAVEVSVNQERTYARAASSGATVLTSPLTAPSNRLFPEISLRVLDASGKHGPAIKLPDVYFSPGKSSWSRDGSELLYEMQKIPEVPGRSIPVVLHFNPATGEFYDTTGAIASYEAPAADSAIGLEQKVIEMSEPTVRKASISWWLRSKEESKRPVALITEHAEKALVAKGEKFVAYTVGGALFVRQAIEITAEQYEQTILAAERTEYVSNGKQIGLAMAMYSADHDDVIPSDFDPMRDLNPYLKNQSLLDGFVMVFPGGRLIDIKDPAKTVFGYFDRPDGRAVVYMDSHVKWEQKN